jgi:hypothetical protein
MNKTLYLENNMNILSQRRQTQIQRERKLDNILKTLPCQQTVLSYLLTLRQNNRNRVQEYSTISITSYFSMINKHMDQVDLELDRLERILSMLEPCKRLEEMTDT